MIKNISNLGIELSKTELKDIIGGDPCVSHTGGSCSYSHNFCDHWWSGGEYNDCMVSAGCSCYLKGPVIVIGND